MRLEAALQVQPAPVDHQHLKARTFGKARHMAVGGHDLVDHGLVSALTSTPSARVVADALHWAMDFCLFLSVI